MNLVYMKAPTHSAHTFWLYSKILYLKLINLYILSPFMFPIYVVQLSLRVLQNNTVYVLHKLLQRIQPLEESSVVCLQIL